MRKGLIAGAIGGLAGTWAMNEAQRAWTRAVDGEAPDSAGGKHDARDWQERSEGRNSNELAAQAIATRVLGHRLTDEELRVAAPLIHFLFGAAVGALYGVYAEGRRRQMSGVGFGTTVWLLADEIAMPLLRLSAPTTRRPVELHLQSFASHVVFGTTTEMTRRAVMTTSSRPQPPVTAAYRLSTTMPREDDTGGRTRG